jgi:AcrR family transcriptional regulator
MNDTKKRIKETALLLFLKKGYSVGINEIISEAKTSKGAFYHHFKSKSELFNKTIDEFFFENYNQLDTIISNSDISLRDKVKLMIKAAFDPFEKISILLSKKEAVNYIKIISEYPNHSDLKKRSINHFKKLIDAFYKLFNNALLEKKVAKKVDIHTLSTHMELLIDGAIIDAILLFDNVSDSEKACIKSAEQLLDYFIIC